jgi:DNA-binding NarL/FixJ family response regulator
MQRILLADDNSDLRAALCLLLQTRFCVELILEARDMEHVLALVEDVHPHYIILDWELPGRPTHQRVPVLRALAPGLKVIAFSVQPESKEDALREGADAFICKTESPDMILDKLQGVFCQEKQG